MEVVHPRCAGLDVHKDLIVACVRLGGPGGVQQEVRKFGATSEELLSLSEWLSECRCTHVAMEATGVYWKPVWHVLEGNFELVLGNAAHIKNVPGRKTDVNDATWIADLLAHGLIRSSFVPPRPVQELRDLTRTRKQLVREVAQHTQRIQKTLEDANVKLSSVLSDVLGQSGRAILDAIVAGGGEDRRFKRTTRPARPGPGGCSAAATVFWAGFGVVRAARRACRGARWKAEHAGFGAESTRARAGTNGAGWGRALERGPTPRTRARAGSGPGRGLGPWWGGRGARGSCARSPRP
jgi:hypothetical protein